MLHAMNEEEPKTLREKIKARSVGIKERGKSTRARKEGQVAASLAKIVKKAAQIADLMTGEDVEEDLRVLRDAKHATHHVYDTKKKCLVSVPDHKTRLAATTLSRAYHEGKPVERSVALTGDFDDLAEMQRRLEVVRNRGLPDSLQKTVQRGQEIPPALPDATTEEGERAN
jgi:hypothetical protein